MSKEEFVELLTQAGICAENAELYWAAYGHKLSDLTVEQFEANLRVALYAGASLDELGGTIN